MKLRIYKYRLNKAMLWYHDKLMEKFSNTLVHSASVEQMNQYIQILQNHQQRVELDEVWKVPVKVVPDQVGISFNVVFDVDNVLFLDFDVEY